MFVEVKHHNYLTYADWRRKLVCDRFSCLQNYF